MPDVKEILKLQKLKQTDARIAILNYLIEQKKALDLGALESVFGKQFDRATIFRTLKTLSEKHILQSISDSSSRTQRYMFLSQHVDHEQHPHFKCESCGRVECLTITKQPEFEIPKDYVMERINWVVEGTCGDCVT